MECWFSRLECVLFVCFLQLCRKDKEAQDSRQEAQEEAKQKRIEDAERHQSAKERNKYVKKTATGVNTDIDTKPEKLAFYCF